MWETVKKIFGAPSLIITEEFRDILERLESTDQNFFLTGKAGTGKSTLVDHFRNHTKKKVVVLAPTGLAAINVAGQTIHSFFKLPPRMITRDVVDSVRVAGQLYKQTDTIVIDEASMVRADLLDGIDRFLRRHGKDKNRPFGGIQIILVGDLLQLPPVVRREDEELLSKFYETPYFFSAASFLQGEFTKVELSEIFRQDDEKFVRVLNRIRIGDVDEEVLEVLNGRVARDEEGERGVTLTTVNRVAAEINLGELAKLTGREWLFLATFDGDFPQEEGSIPAEPYLRLKPGAKVMFIKNGGVWVNGSLGTVEAIAESGVTVRLEGSDQTVEVPTDEWQHVRYEFDEKENRINAKVLGTMHQLPLKLAWAITIHKSQGMTFNKVNIDFSRSPFAHGQTYVALSRCRTISGITLSRGLFPRDVIVDYRVKTFLEE